MTPHLTPSPLQEHVGCFQFCPVSIHVYLQDWNCWVRGSPLTFQVPSKISRQSQLQHMGRLPSSFSFPTNWQWMSKAEFMLCWLSLCGQAGSLPLPSSGPVDCWYGKKKGVVWTEGSLHQQTFCPFHSVWQWDPGLSRGPGLSQQDRGCRESAGAAEQRAESCRWGEGSVQGHRTLPGTGHRSPRSSRAFTKSHPLAVPVPG